MENILLETEDRAEVLYLLSQPFKKTIILEEYSKFGSYHDFEYDWEADQIIRLLEGGEAEEVGEFAFKQKATVYGGKEITIKVFIERITDMVYASELDKPDCIFNTMVLSHGLNAYNGKNTINNLKKIIDGKDMEICCAHKYQHIGPVGIYVMGEVHCVSNTDLHSIKGEKGRAFRMWYAELINSPAEIDFSAWSHMEYIITPRKIVGLWYKEGISEDLLQELQEITRRLNLKVYKVK